MVLHISVKRGTCRIFPLSPHVRLRHCVGIITFVVFLVTYAILVIQRSSLTSYLWTRSSWFAGKIKDFDGFGYVC